MLKDAPGILPRIMSILLFLPDKCIDFYFQIKTKVMCKTVRVDSNAARNSNLDLLISKSLPFQ